ncbi:MAG: sugar transporter permease [Thermomicrobiales bacterium]|jgi:ABC-type sugar transport system permease subunit|nr:sugar transporter permease [Thermomicrobiales bacterium]MDF2761820.1 sugar transporter permease [Thermomicrobiales bacterium]
MSGTTLDAPFIAPSISPARRSWRRYRAGILFVLPALILYLIFMVYPFFQSIYFSFTSWNGVTAVKEWVGLANYYELIKDDLFWLSLQHTVIWVIVGTIAPIAIGMLLAILLWRRPKGFTLFRTFYFMPQVLSAVVIGIVWNWIYNPIFGILNESLDAFGLEDLSRGWLGDPDVALYAVLIAAIWATIGLCFVIFLAGLQNVSKDLLEAATVDGANAWQRFWNVTVPQLASVINVVVALLLIGGFSVFDIIFVMTGGGPANATEVLATYTYKEAFTQNNVGYASTLSVVITVISLIASVTFIRLRERQEA